MIDSRIDIGLEGESTKRQKIKTLSDLIPMRKGLRSFLYVG